MRQLAPRLVSVGNVLVDIAAYLDAVPEAGADVVADLATMLPGGCFATLATAVGQGLPSAHAGATGTGVLGHLARAGLRDAGVEILLPPTSGLDSGYVLVLVEAGGERRFITAFGAEATLTADQLSGLTLQPLDLVHVSGYGLLARTNAEVIPPWLLGLTADHLVLLDPGPLVADIHPDVLLAVLERADWVSCNEREAQLITGRDDPRMAAAALTGHGGSAVVRLGARGSLVATQGRIAVVEGLRADVVDTTGAGDVHVGAFLAGLAAGLDPVEAAWRANACAARSVGIRGAVAAPVTRQNLCAE